MSYTLAILLAALGLGVVLGTHTTVPLATFEETFNAPFTLEERWPIWKSESKDWWVSSGAYLISENGIGRTLSGDLDANRWIGRYQRANPTDTSGGKRPQNIFRLVMQRAFLDGSQEVYARVRLYEPSASPNRNASNGVLLFNRYQNEDTLYYVGVRVDGYAVIKKKYEGTYTTLGFAPVFGTEGRYDRDLRPILLPLDQWFGIRSVVRNVGGGVLIELFVDSSGKGKWEKFLSVVDRGAAGPAIVAPGYGGIRTDFMDVEFDDYRLENVY